jgi:hypothetical protein
MCYIVGYSSSFASGRHGSSGRIEPNQIIVHYSLLPDVLIRPHNSIRPRKNASSVETYGLERGHFPEMQPKFGLNSRKRVNTGLTVC